MRLFLFFVREIYILSYEKTKGGITMFIKAIGKAIIMGAATAVGGYMANRVIQVCSDPYKKAVLKQNLSNIKKTFVAKEGA